MSNKEIIESAKRLIKAGEAIGDQDMISRGKQLLAEAKPKPKNDFIAPTRKPGAQQIQYDEDGNVKRVARTEQIDISNIHNEWEDDGQEFHDKANEILQKTARHSPRTRAAYQPIQVTCECGFTEQINPALKPRVYKCAKCIRRLGRS